MKPGLARLELAASISHAASELEGRGSAGESGSATRAARDSPPEPEPETSESLGARRRSHWQPEAQVRNQDSGSDHSSCTCQIHVFVCPPGPRRWASSSFEMSTLLLKVLLQVRMNMVCV